MKKLSRSYIFPDVAKQIEKEVYIRLQNKEYDNITSAKAFAAKLTEDLQFISKDLHLRVRYSYKTLPVRKVKNEPTRKEKLEFENYLKHINHGFEKVERMPGNIGCIDLRKFTNPELGAETVAAAMNFVGNTDALIFDLRQNGGGNPAMVALICSYLFGEKTVHLNNLYWREGDKTEEFWTNPAVPGKKYGDAKSIFVLTSKQTFSAAEEFSNNLKILKRASIIGEVTGGAANPGEMFRLNKHFGIFIPTGRAINPITKTNWEGTGVEPDVKAPKEQALKIAYLIALNKSLSKTGDDDLKEILKDLINQTQTEIDEMKIIEAD